MFDYVATLLANENERILLSFQFDISLLQTVDMQVISANQIPSKSVVELNRGRMGDFRVAKHRTKVWKNREDTLVLVEAERNTKNVWAKQIVGVWNQTIRGESAICH